MTDTKNTRKIQEAILRVYKEVMRICEKNNIPIFAVGGTALGAVRHHGFIPWDDDMDLGIRVDDFERFRRACKRDLGDNFAFTELDFFGGKVYDKTTTFLEAQCMMFKNQYYGAFVDIFPIIGTPNSVSERASFLKRMQSYYHDAFIFDRYPDSSLLSRKELSAKKEYFLHSYAIAASERVAEFASGTWFTKNPAGMDNLIKMSFEDTFVYIPSSFDEDLTAQYGEYMALPPKEERYTHNKYSLVDLAKPFDYYWKKLQELEPALGELLLSKHQHEGIFYRDLLKISADFKDLYAENRALKKDLSELQNKFDATFDARIKKKYKYIRERLASKVAH